MRSFVWLGFDHVIVLLLTLAVALVLARVPKRASERTSRLLGWLLAGALLAGQVASVARSAASGMWLQDLPLQLCDVAAFAAAVALVRGGRWAYDLTYFLAFGGTLQALLTPDLAAGFPDPAFLLFFFTHASVMIAAAYLTVGMGCRPEPMSIVRALVFLQVYALVVGAVDAWLGVDYGYLCHKPAHRSLLDALGPWPLYLVLLEVLALIVFAVAYAPFFVLDMARRRRAQGTP